MRGIFLHVLHVTESRLQFQDIRRRFGRLAVLTGVSGAVGPGGMLLVTGPNGSGKSTLLRCLSGLLAPDGGTIEYRETNGGPGAPLDAAERRQRVGMVSPDLAFYAELTVEENLAFFAGLRRVPPDRGLAVLGRLGLPLDRLAGALSSGMRQRLRWAWALLHSPRLLLLDEPFQNFDAPGERTARELLAEHLAGGGLAVVANPSALDFDHAERLDLGR
ncbi:MAG TPA: ABC transporter ATP-binding protein [Thermoanaerobaculia bacterium]|nr:ABC transporter ATP-binding protein [Thermoanaerobaculia bacterium]